MKVVAGDGVAFSGQAFEVRGRAKPGHKPVQLQPIEVAVDEAGPLARATDDAVAYMEKVASAVDSVVPLSTSGTAQPIAVPGCAPYRQWLDRYEAVGRA